MSQKIEHVSDGKLGETVKDLSVLTLLWLAGLIIVNPLGDFPLNDDWSFGLAVKYFIQYGSFHPTGWTSMSLLTNVLWGSIFCLPAGFSFTALRFSTLAASLLAIWGVYWIVKETRQPRPVALLAAFTLAFNPIYFELSNTFMTDVPCLALMIFSALFFLKYLKGSSHGSALSLILATAFSMAAILSRQASLAVPLAFAFVLIFQRGFGFRVLLTALTSSFLSLMTLVVFQHWLAVAGRTPILYNNKFVQMFYSLNHLPRVGAVFVQTAYFCLVYTGLFLSPMLFFIRPDFSRGTRKSWIIPGAIVIALAGFACALAIHGRAFMIPCGQDILNPSGMGPLTLRDSFFYEKGDVLPGLPKAFWLAVTLIGWLGAALAIYQTEAVFRRIFPTLYSSDQGYEACAAAFLVLIPVIYIAPFLVDNFLDRYLIPMVPFLAVGFAASVPFRPQNLLPPSKFFRFITLGLMIAFFIFSVCGARDYLAWNRTRWLALNDLLADGRIKPSNVDGGFEFNGYYLYNSRYQAGPQKSFWWVYDDSYSVTFTPLAGYNVIREYPYTHWMPPFKGHIYVSKKNPEDHPENDHREK